MTKRELARQLARLLATQPGFTVDANGNPLARGFTVGGLKRDAGDALARFSQPTNPVELDALTAAVAETLDAVTDLLQDGAYVGGWHQDGDLVLDLVTVTRGQKRAARLALERQQLAYGQIDNYQYVNEWRVSNGDEL